jgi:hypothetical protein
MSKLEIAATAAQLVVEEGLEYGPAKRRAARQLKFPERTPLPGNDEVEEAVREYLDLFCADTQPMELLALRRLALTWMERLADFRPHLSGAVWHGTATRFSDVHIQLFCDDGKSLEIKLIDQGIRYQPRSVSGLHGDVVDVLDIHAMCQPLGVMVGIHLMVNDLDDLRGALRKDAKNKSPRGDLKSVRLLLSNFDFKC